MKKYMKTSGRGAIKGDAEPPIESLKSILTTETIC